MSRGLVGSDGATTCRVRAGGLEIGHLAVTSRSATAARRSARKRVPTADELWRNVGLSSDEVYIAVDSKPRVRTAQREMHSRVGG